MPEQFNWVELGTGDLDKSRAFYKGLLDWKYEELPMPEGDYTMISNGGEPFAGMMANKGAEQPTQWMPYIKVEDVDAVTAKAKELGATIVVEPTDIPKGRFSVVVDPVGASIGIMS